MPPMQNKYWKFMRNTAKKTSILILAVVFAHTASAQLFKKKLELPESKLMLVKMGPLVGLEQGNYLNFIFGRKRRSQHPSFIKPQPPAANFHLDNILKYRVLGAQLGIGSK